MSNEQVKQIDAVVKWSVSTIIGLCAFALTVMYFSATGDLKYLMIKVGSTDERLIKIETQMTERDKAEALRNQSIDDAIKDIKQSLKEIQK